MNYNCSLQKCLMISTISQAAVKYRNWCLELIKQSRSFPRQFFQMQRLPSQAKSTASNKVSPAQGSMVKPREWGSSKRNKRKNSTRRQKSGRAPNNFSSVCLSGRKHFPVASFLFLSNELNRSASRRRQWQSYSSTLA